MSAIVTGQAAGYRTADRDGVLIITLDHPPANALNNALLRALTSLFAELAEQASPPPVVLTGHGERFFCPGGDIRELDGAEQSELDGRMREFHALLVAMENYPRPVVAAINGYCVGGGMEIALVADQIVAGPTARFGFPEINHGLLPADKGIQRAKQLLGLRVTRSLTLSGELFDVDHAVRIGLVDDIVDHDELIEAATHRARAAGEKAPVLYAQLKRSINDPDDIADAKSLQRTLAAAHAYYGDPATQRLRQSWSASRATKPAPQC